MKFGKALEEMEQGNRVCRTGWNGKGQYVYLAQLTPDTESVFIIRNAQGQKQPGWLASQGDMKATDWEVFVPHHPV